MTIYMRALTATNGIAADPETSKPLAPQAFTFPGGEHHLKNIPEFDEPVMWIADVRGADSGDLIIAAMLADYVHSHAGDHRFTLMLPYIPAARADRGEPLGIRVYAGLINSMCADRVIVIDPHSDVAARYIDQIRIVDHVELIVRALDVAPGRYDGVIAPDKGARDRAAKAAAALGLDLYQADKHRDFETGRILNIRMLDELPSAGRYLVIDDICDGGGTFKMLAQATGKSRDQLGLWVTHGIFSGAAVSLVHEFGQILTSDSHPGHNRVGVANVIVPTFVPMMRHVDKP